MTERPPPSSGELDRVRERIDELDTQIVRLLNERARLGLGAGAAKASAGASTLRDEERERAVLERVAALNDGPLRDEDLLALYRRLIAATHDLEAAVHGGEPAGAAELDAARHTGPRPTGRDRAD